MKTPSLMCLVVLVGYAYGNFSSQSSVVDCAYGQWSDYRPYTSGLLIRTRQIIRRAKNGGQGCTGSDFEIRNATAVRTTSVSKFLSFFLSGDRRETTLAYFPLRKGQVPQKYVFSRDIVFVIDRTLFAPALPLYKSLIANLIGSVCGNIGRVGNGNIYSLITYDANRPDLLHSFNDKQDKMVIQNKILSITSSDGLGQPSLIEDAMKLANDQISVFSAGTRAYHVSNKDVVLFITYRKMCDLNAAVENAKLKVNGRVYVVVLGESGDTTTSPQDWCLEDFSSREFEFHFLWVKSFEDLREFSTWALEITSYFNPCAEKSSQGQENQAKFF